MDFARFHLLHSLYGNTLGAYLAHILTTRTSVTGRVVSNAPGPIDLGAGIYLLFVFILFTLTRSE